MGMMKGLEYFTDIPLVLWGLALFFGVYIGLIAWLVRPARTRRVYTELENLPLRETEITYER